MAGDAGTCSLGVVGLETVAWRMAGGGVNRERRGRAATGREVT